VTQALRTDVHVADLFCGAGGSSTGLARACADFGLDLKLTAVNHWDVAIATHTQNHPGARHWCMDLDQARPFDLVPERILDIMWASPSCTEHSYAKGGNDVDDQMRASAWSVPRMAEALKPRVIIVENVAPFRNWGPVEPVMHRNGKPKLDKDGKPIHRPIKSRKGETFRAWFSAIESLGYTGSWRLMNSADYGEAQTRIRWFGVFTAHGVKYEWPAPTHAKRGDPSLLGELEPWVPARKIIDLGLSKRSIFDPVFGRMQNQYLSQNTIRRIVAGVVRYCSIDYTLAFLVVLRRHADALSLDEPLPTVVAGGTHLALAEPSVTPFVGGNRMNNVPTDVDDPLATVTTAHGGGLFLAEPEFVLGQHGGSVARELEEPIPTVATKGAISIIEPIIIDVRHGDTERGVESIDEPLKTLTAKNGIGVAEPFIVSYAERDGEGYGKNVASPKGIDEPLGTVITRDRFAVAEPFVVEAGRTDDRRSNLDEPLSTVTGSNRVGIVEPFIVPQMGDGVRSIDDPTPTVLTTTRGMRLIEPFLAAHFGEREGQAPRVHGIDDPFPTVTHRGAGDLAEPVLEPATAAAPADRIVEIDGKLCVVDVRFRMLQPYELARAQGFADSYVFTGSKSDQTAQIGNAVPEKVAYALGRAALIALGYGAAEAAA
jgi:DNA (cytosine-5)-methyltransferase 1